MLTLPHGRTSDLTASYFVKLKDAPLGFVTNTVMLGSAFISGRQRVAVARYQMMCLVFVYVLCVKIDINCNLEGLLHHPIWLKLLWALFGIIFQLFQLLCLAKDQ